MNTKEAVLLVGHGTKDIDGANEFRAFGDLFSRKVTGKTASACFFEYAEPSLSSEIERLAEQGHSQIEVVPLFLLAGGHVKIDLPELLDEARRDFPELDISFGKPIGVRPAILDMLKERLERAAQETGTEIPPEETAVLLVEAGSSDPEANSEVYKVARLLWENSRFGWVEPAFTFVARPTVLQGIDGCVKLGARRIIVLPYFLFNGVLVKRIHAWVAQKQAQYPELVIGCAGYIGLHPHLLDIALDLVKGLDNLPEIAAQTATYQSLRYKKAASGEEERQEDD